MRQNLFALLLVAAVSVSGCATKKYVRQTVDPVQTKVNQVADQTNKQGADLAQTQQDVAKNTTAISAVDEKATRQLGQLRQVIVNLDDYKVVNQGAVLFGLNKSALTKDDKQQLDQVVSNVSSLKRYFIAVEGFTDQTGSASYNLELSKRRADAVVQYLVGEKNLDFNHIHTIGLGKQKLVDPGKGRDARAKNRRVQIEVYSADAATAGLGAGSQ